jgi:hypothetical protein
MARLEYCDDAEKRASAFLDPYDAIKVLWGYSSGAHRVLIGYSGYSQGCSPGAHRVSQRSICLSIHLSTPHPSLRISLLLRRPSDTRAADAQRPARMPACALARARMPAGASQVFYTPAMRRILRRIDDLAAAHPPARLTCVCVYIYTYIYICIDR